MMTNKFFEKLKKGMDIEEEKINKNPEIEENTEAEAGFQNISIEEVKPEKSQKISKKRKLKKNDKIEIKQESILRKDEITEEMEIFEKQGQLTIDLYETNKHIIIQSAVGGIKPEDLEIIIEKDMVCIRGKRERCEEEEVEKIFFQECYWGKFSREIIFPTLVDSSKSQASLENGILTIKIPKSEGQNDSQKIDIKTV